MQTIIFVQIRYFSRLHFFLFCLQSEKNVFSQFESWTGIKLPVVLIKVLEQCGFDFCQTLKCIEQNSIHEIEEFLNEDLGKHREILRGSVYEHKSVFKLLPGHRALI